MLPRTRSQMRAMSAKRAAEFAKTGRVPWSTLDKPTAPKMAAKPGQAKLVAPKAKRYPSTDADAETAAAVLERDEHRCICCGDPLWGRRGFEWCIAHRLLRSRGGDNRMSNLYSSCGNGTTGCEGLTHAHPERATAAGYMVPSGFDPASVPMEHAVHGTVLLLDDGSWVKHEEASA